jgi:UDP-N-acetylmuramoyl-L-alanyl-D-glutamate--2,6-diaminopimelate ligase
MGTVERSYPGRREASEHTTQESLEIQHFLRDARNAGATAAVIEVSSHALSLDRVAECDFDGALFTNLEPDHQDFYAGMEPYFLAKRRLFEGYNPPVSKKKMIAVVNEDDSYGKRILAEGKIFSLGFSEKKAAYSYSALQSEGAAVVGTVNSIEGKAIPIHSRLAATRFNLANIAGCVALAHALKIPKLAISRGVSNLEEIPGRLTRVPTRSGVQVYVDFAHSGPKLRSVLQALRDIARGRLITVFGAGGDKDPLRRTRMGEAAADLADHTFITTDNPRSEDPLKIIEAIESAWRNRQNETARAANLIVEPDREQAIRLALQMASGDDIVCIAGKGHEQGQIVKDQVFPFDDVEVATRCLEELEKCLP